MGSPLFSFFNSSRIHGFSEYLGIDVGGTNVKMGVVDAKTGKITNFYSHDTDSWRQSGHFMDQFADAIAVNCMPIKK